MGKLGDVEQLEIDFVGEEGLEYSGSTGDRYFRVFGLHWGSRSLTLMGILKLNSFGELYSKFSLVEDLNDVSQGISSEMA